ncbi:inactive TPR repeat-containing thioredoxin TTL3-like [Typha angustifolia]|uniref:inactive TPR repeat-containing thioredoxin TTL3-like n=1 Tax=Typha angustifolia TaxID=59011 RepID=UPI003C2E0F19
MEKENETTKSSGCGLLVLYNNVFRRRNCRQPSSATPSGPTLTPSNSKRRRSVSDGASLLPVTTSPLGGPKSSLSPGFPKAPGQGRPPESNRAFPGAAGWARCNAVAAELDSMIHDHQRSKGSGALVRASSGNVMVFGNLGNIRAPGGVTPNRNVLDYLPKTAKEMRRNEGDVKKIEPAAVATPEVLCRALSRRVAPEELKEMGNEEYKKGRFEEAVELYERAILMDAGKASYWSNKAASLMGMGRFLDAVADCREAVRIDPSYGRAHLRLASLYLRLGEAERAIHHYKLAKNDATAHDISRAQALHGHLSKCSEARKQRNWHALLKESQSALSAGADSSPQVLAFQEEALLALQKHEEADTALHDAPKFDFDAATKFFGAASNAYFLAVHAQVDMAAGRFEGAVAIAQKAAWLDPSNREVNAVARKARSLASARSKGNDLFKASKIQEACIQYQEGLDHDPHNAILLCNRAACRSKLGQLEKAIEDCSTALSMRPSYSKARLRRADCNAKLEHWEASIQDYEALLREMPGDGEVAKALLEAQCQLEKQKGREVMNTNGDDNFITITTQQQFRQFTASPGLYVVLIFSKCNDVPSSTFSWMEQLRKQYPTVNFLKVDMEQFPDFTECESSLPLFKLYKDGSSIESIAASDRNKVESSLKNFSK